MSHFWKGRTVGDVWPHARKIICFQADDQVEECLRILEKQGIISAPVLKGNELLGFIDTQQILTFLLAIYPKTIESLEALTPETFEEIVQKGKSFSSTPVSDVIELNKKLKFTQDVFPVEHDTPIEKLLDMFYLGVHRVPVISKTGVITNVITQSDFLQVLAQCLPVLGDLNARTLRDLRLTEGKELQAVTEAKPVISVLSIMHRKSISAVPVVDENGKIVANFSASNLKDTNIYNFAEMLLGVKEFLELQNLRAGPFLVKLQHKKSLHPVTCMLDSTFHSIVTEMAALRIHRIWVVDGDNRLIGVVSLGDLFQVFLDWGAPNRFRDQ